MHFRHFIWQRVVWLRNTSHKFVCGKGLALLVNTVLRVGAIHLGKHAKDYKTWFTYLSPNLKA